MQQKDMETVELALLNQIIDELKTENGKLKDILDCLKYQHELGFIHFDNEDDVSLITKPIND